MIRLENISKAFNKGKPNETSVFNHFNLQIKNNDFVILVGSNGSGKSTLLNLLAGTVRPDTGSVFLDEKEISNLPDYKRSTWIARIFQNPVAGTAPDLTVIENFRLAACRTKSKKLSCGINDSFRKQVEEKISILNLGLEDKLDIEMGSLSGGQRQALALMMAIMDDTKLLLLDEPTAALDPRTSDLIMRLTEKVIEEFNLTALLVTHRLSDVVHYGSRIIQLKEGVIVRDFTKSKEDLLKMNDIYEWFGQ